MLQVAERGLKFVQGFTRLLALRQANGQLPALFREAWAFSACMSLAGAPAPAAALFASLQSLCALLRMQQLTC